LDAPGRRFMPANWPLILVSGMGADHRLLDNQVAAFPNAIVLPWLEPEPRETLAAYARRMARANDPGGPCFVGGVSLGGMIAQEMSRHLDARACFLVSTIRSSRQLPLRIRTLRPLRPVLSGVFFWSLKRLAQAMLLAQRGPQPGYRQSCLEQFVGADPRFLRWAARAVLQWTPVGTPPHMPVRHIHGDRDHLLPHRLTQPDVLVPGAGHLMVLTHAEAVNEFLRAGMERYGK